ncbi:hypothetical protein O181_047014 [Austropuccinia psidii MF-1]|uniref:Uncharacterized protein n=1 Tax=Austropuccinia psidii MF-1 TaxID=1389203 RepID=A0A9Q3DQ79_9BASI|nr:hypothetical protein [Austropuccinia psidii MF-1]
MVVEQTNVITTNSTDHLSSQSSLRLQDAFVQIITGSNPISDDHHLNNHSNPNPPSLTVTTHPNPNHINHTNHNPTQSLRSIVGFCRHILFRYCL